MMQMHTPGPWSVVEGYDGSRTVAILRDFRRGLAGPGVHVAADHDWVGRAPIEQIFANANLIAAAPELLAVLKALVAVGCLGVIKDVDAYQKAWDAVPLAIAKAEGR